MTREEMLKKMGLTHEELNDLLHKFRNFESSLNENQRAVVTQSLPTAAAAAKSFGPDISAHELERLIKPDRLEGIFAFWIARLGLNK
jgi:hypothetical protein